MVGAVLLVLMVPAIAGAQLRSAAITFQGVGCASCIESLPARIQRMRGVESARVDADKSLLIVQLAERNRIRVEQLRDAIQQDGTKAVKAEVSVRGQLEEENGAWMLKAPPPASPLTLALDEAPPSIQYSVKAGEATVTGNIPELGASTLKIVPSEIKPAGGN